jgi:pimeloyl-ACP methyl ester carboxylesterase
VIATELQGHGRTADVDRPLAYEQLADDVAALLQHLQVAPADVYGYSLGGGAALQLALRHPKVVRKLVLVSACYTSDGLHPEVMGAIEHLQPEMFHGTPWHTAYEKIAPHPEAFATLVGKMRQLDLTTFAWSAEDVRAMAAPTLIIIGDSDGTTPEHAVEMFRLRGGGVFGDIVGLPTLELAILPGTTHVGILDQADLLLTIVPRFLAAPMP